jgi:hypothetical protein
MTDRLLGSQAVDFGGADELAKQSEVLYCRTSGGKYLSDGQHFIQLKRCALESMELPHSLYLKKSRPILPQEEKISDSKNLLLS